MADYRPMYRQLRNYLAGQHLGSTRDEALLREVVKVLLCKAQLDKQLGRTRARASGPQIRHVWVEVRETISVVFASNEVLDLQDEVLAYMDRVLADIDLHDPTHDVFGDVYEIFVGSLAKGQEGQFFTPPNAVQLLVELVDPQPGETVLDPACGAGSFLASTARHLLRRGDSPEAAVKSVIGIDKDSYLAQLCALRLALLAGGNPTVYCADSLAWRSKEEFPDRKAFGQVDVILTNPPFGSKIVAVSQQVQRDFSLAFRWRKDRGSGRYEPTDQLQRSISPQVAFMERCLDLLRPGGRLGMVVPESLMSSSRYGYVIQFLMDAAEIRAVIGMPESLFKVSGSGGTHTKTCLLVAQKKVPPQRTNRSIFMAEAKWCGNDSRGRSIDRDDLPEIGRRYKLTSTSRPVDHLSYDVRQDQLVENILAPRYYDPQVGELLAKLHPTHELISVGELMQKGLLEIRTGDEIGKQAYGTGPIPFVRTSDLSNWEIKVDPKHGVSEELYESLAPKQDVREGDILMVRDGTYLIGTCAYVTEYDERILYQSHLLKIRVLRPDLLSPFLLLAALSSVPVKRQIAAKRFTQDIIDSLGGRVQEIVLPLPRNEALRVRVTDKVKKAIRERVEARELARQACIDLVGEPLADVADDELTV